MNEIEALDCAGRLAGVDTRPWPEERITGWAEAMKLSPDYAAGVRASQALINQVDPRDWSVARWREAYRQAVASEAPPSLPRGTEKLVTLAEHLEWLREQADESWARTELAIWERSKIAAALS